MLINFNIYLSIASKKKKKKQLDFIFFSKVKNLNSKLLLQALHDSLKIKNKHLKQNLKSIKLKCIYVCVCVCFNFFIFSKI